MSEIRFLLLSVVLIFGTMSIPAQAQVNCTMSGSFSQNGSCFEFTMTANCSDGTQCFAQYGGCDWGNVSAVYFFGTC